MVSDLNKLIFNGQKQIKIVDRYKDVWQVVEEYQSDELGSVLEDENKLKKAKEAGDRKGKQDKRVNGPVAQLVEQRCALREVVSSTLAGPTLRVLK